MKANTTESLNQITERVSQRDILERYFGIYNLPVLVSSPLRPDRHPSFWIYAKDNNKVKWIDYGTGEKGDVYTLMERYYNLSFKEVVMKVGSEMVPAGVTIEACGARKRKHSTHDLQVKVRDWEEHDLRYWESYGISLPWLRYAEVYPISHKIVYKEDQRYVFHAAKYAYAFVERKEGKVSIKVYQPLSTLYKWSNSNDGSVVGLWTKIPQGGNILVVCSSLKDALCLWANTGIPALYLQSESMSISPIARKVLESRFKRICICFDNDVTGLKKGESLSKATGYENIVIPQFDGGKDISDAFKAMGKERFVEFIKPLFDGKQKSS